MLNRPSSNTPFTLLKLHSNIEATLDHGKPWLVGDTYSLADLGLTPYLARLEYLKLLEVWISNKKNTKIWWQRIKDRPSYKKAVSDPLTMDEIGEMNNSGSKIKNQIILIRDKLPT